MPKFRTSFFSGQFLLLSTTVLNDIHTYKCYSILIASNCLLKINFFLFTRSVMHGEPDQFRSTRATSEINSFVIMKPFKVNTLYHIHYFHLFYFYDLVLKNTPHMHLPGF